jgi:hypothetical protein
VVVSVGTVDDVVVDVGARVVTGAMVLVVVDFVGALSAGVHAATRSAATMRAVPNRDMKLEDTPEQREPRTDCVSVLGR